MRRLAAVVLLLASAGAAAEEPLIALVRPRASLPAEAAHEPLAADLVVAYAFDAPRRPRYATAGDLARLALDGPAARARARANLAALLGPLDRYLRVVPRDSVAVLRTGRRFDASRLLAPEDWASVAADMRGGLLVIPAADEVVVYGDAAKPGIRDDLRELARHAMDSSTSPIALTILRWTKGGWTADAP